LHYADIVIFVLGCFIWAQLAYVINIVQDAAGRCYDYTVYNPSSYCSSTFAGFNALSSANVERFQQSSPDGVTTPTCHPDSLSSSYLSAGEWAYLYASTPPESRRRQHGLNRLLRSSWSCSYSGRFGLGFACFLLYRSLPVCIR